MSATNTGYIEITNELSSCIGMIDEQYDVDDLNIGKLTLLNTSSTKVAKYRLYVRAMNGNFKLAEDREEYDIGYGQEMAIITEQELGRFTNVANNLVDADSIHIEIMWLSEMSFRTFRHVIDLTHIAQEYTKGVRLISSDPIPNTTYFIGDTINWRFVASALVSRSDSVVRMGIYGIDSGGKKRLLLEPVDEVGKTGVFEGIYVIPDDFEYSEIVFEHTFYYHFPNDCVNQSKLRLIRVLDVPVFVSKRGNIISTLSASVNNVCNNSTNLIVNAHAREVLGQTIWGSLVVTKPDGSTETLGEFTDTTSYTYDARQIINQVGNYKYTLRVQSDGLEEVVEEVIVTSANCSYIVEIDKPSDQYCVDEGDTFRTTVEIHNIASGQPYNFNVWLVNPVTLGHILKFSGVDVTDDTTRMTVIHTPTDIGDWKLKVSVIGRDASTFREIEYNAVQCNPNIPPTEYEPNDCQDDVEALGFVLEPVPDATYTLSYSPELNGWDSVHRFRPVNYLGNDLMVDNIRNITTIGRTCNMQHSIIEKVTKFRMFSIINTVNVLSEKNIPEFITIKNNTRSTRRIPFRLFIEAGKYGEREFLALIRSFTFDDDKLELDFINAYNQTFEVEDGNNEDFMEGEYCIVRLEYLRPFRLYDIQVDTNEQIN